MNWVERNVCLACGLLLTIFTVTFTFTSPVYIQSGVLYAFVVHSTSLQYNLYSALSGENVFTSTTNGQPTTLNSPPYVGSLFLSQNSQTWSADQNESMMFVIERCVFSVGTLPTLQFVVPNKLPYRKVVEQDVEKLDEGSVGTIFE